MMTRCCCMWNLKMKGYSILFLLQAVICLSYSSREFLNFGHLVLSSDCSSVSLSTVPDVIDQFNSSDFSINFKETCLDSNEVVLIGPSFCSFLKSEEISVMVLTKKCIPYCDYIISITSQIGIPILQIDPYLVGQSTYLSKFQNFNLYPEEEVIKAVEDLIVYKKNENFALLYDSSSGINLALNILRNFDIEIISIELPPRSVESYNSTLKSILIEIRSWKPSNIIFHSSAEYIPEVLDLALFLGLLNKEYSWIITNLELLYQDVNMYIMSDVSITVFEFQNSEVEITNGVKTPLTGYEDMFLYDTFLVVVEAVRYLKENRNLSSEDFQKNYTCEESQLWSTGLDIMQTIEENILITGKTGKIDFTNRQRSNCVLNIFGLYEESFIYLGNWSAINGIQLNESLEEKENYLQVLRVVTILDAPFTVLKNNHEELIGNDKYEGLIIDLMELISDRMNFEYEFYVVPDGYFGGQNESGSWNGIINELLEDRADLSAASLTITSARSSVVDFTISYMNTGRNFVIRAPESYSSGFVFIDPLSWEVWTFNAVALVGVCFVIIIVYHINPHKNNLYNYGPEPMSKCKKTQRELVDSFWFVYSSFLQQGVDSINPRSLSIRIVVGSWWIFIFIMISMYTANMTAFLTVERLKTDINSLNDLLDQKEFGYGVSRSGASQEYLNSSKIEPYESLWENMEKNQDWFVDTLIEGMERTCNESYVFFTETVTNLYYANSFSNCKLSVIGNPIGEVGYGLAFQSGNPMRDEFSTVILEMQEEGKIDELKIKWDLIFNEESQSSISSEGSVLKMENLVGIFYILAAGCCLGLIVSIFELIWYKISEKVVSLKLDLDLNNGANGSSKNNKI